MFKRLYSAGGIAYVLGGLGVLAMGSTAIIFGLICLGIPIPEIVVNYSLVAFFVGGLICTTVFDSGNMQVVAQNRTTEMLEKISQQLDERDEFDKSKSRPNRRKYRHKKCSEATEAPCISETSAASVSKAPETTVSQEGYRCPVTGAVIAVRDNQY